MKTINTRYPQVLVIPSRMDIYLRMERKEKPFLSTHWEATYSEFLGDDASEQLLKNTLTLIDQTLLIPPPEGFHFSVQTSTDSNTFALGIIRELLLQLTPWEWDVLKDFITGLIKDNPTTIATLCRPLTHGDIIGAPERVE
jgi:hypothetical protein